MTEATDVRPFGWNREHEEHGWIRYPRDVEYGRRLWVPEAMQHPAKMQLYLVEDLVEYLTVPGDWVLDPFGGTGRTALASHMGRNTTLVEVEAEFTPLIKGSAEKLVPGGKARPARLGGTLGWEWVPPDGLDGTIQLVIGDNRKVVPNLPEDFYRAVITSPPYSTALANAGRLQATMKDTYIGNGFNMGKLNPFLWQRAMEDLFKGLYKVLEPGGVCVMVNKDMRRDGQRALLSIELNKGAKAAGFKLSAWHKWLTPGTNRTNVMAAKGAEVILDEDIMFFKKG